MASLFSNDASLDGVTRRFLDDERGGPLENIGDTSIISAVAGRTGVDGVAILDFMDDENPEFGGVEMKISMEEEEENREKVRR